MIQIFTIPFNPDTQGFSTELVNRFCQSKVIHDVSKEFFQQNHRSYWSILIEYDEITGELPKQQVKQKVTLSDKDQKLFDTIRQWRKAKSVEQGVPVYIIMTNRIAFELVEKKPRTLEELKLVSGVGEKTIAAYGKELIILIEPFHE